MMTNEIAIRNIDDATKVSQALAASGFYKDAKTSAQALVKVMAGVELGITPIAAMTGIHIVEGKVTLGSGLVAAQIQRSGKYRYKILEYTEKANRLRFQELEDGKWTDLEPIVEFTWEDAKRAQLTDKLNWKRYPAAMLFARNLTQGARMHTPSIFAGPVYTPEELGDDDPAKTLDVPHEVISTPPANTPPVAKAEPEPKAEDAKHQETKQAEPKRRELPTQSQMKEIQELSESLALTDKERTDLRNLAASWDKATVEKNLPALRKKIADRKAAGVQQGQVDYVIRITDENRNVLKPAEIVQMIESVHKAESFAVAGQIIGSIVEEINERIKVKNSHAKEETKAEELVSEPIADAVVIEDENPFK